MKEQSMETITIQKSELKSLIEESVREVVSQEFMKFYSLLVPYVSDEEQKDIESQYGIPTREIGKTIEIEI
jgi:hypothetical protein